MPELPTSYPEPSIFGILPAYGFYARHVKGLEVKGLSIGFEKEDTRHAIVLDDVEDASFEDLSLQTAKETQEVAFVTSMYKRPANLEYVPDQPYHMTTITNVTLPENISVKLATVEAPAPGTPRDSFYSCPTLPIPEKVATAIRKRQMYIHYRLLFFRRLKIVQLERQEIRQRKRAVKRCRA